MPQSSTASKKNSIYILALNVNKSIRTVSNGVYLADRTAAMGVLRWLIDAYENHVSEKGIPWPTTPIALFQLILFLAYSSNIFNSLLLKWREIYGFLECESLSSFGLRVVSATVSFRLIDMFRKDSLCSAIVTSWSNGIRRPAPSNILHRIHSYRSWEKAFY